MNGVKTFGPTVHPTKDVPTIQRYGRAAAPRTNWPEIPRVKKELQKHDSRSKKRKRRARTASALLAVAQRDAEAFASRCQIAEANGTTVAKMFPPKKIHVARK